MKGKIRNLLVASAAIVSLGAIAATPAMRAMNPYLSLSDMSSEASDSVGIQETGNSSVVTDGSTSNTETSHVTYNGYRATLINTDSTTVANTINSVEELKGYFSVSKETSQDLLSKDIDGLLIYLRENDNDKSFGKLSDPDLVASKDYVFPTSASVINAFCYPHSISFVEPICLTTETPDAEGMDLVLDYLGKGEETIAVTSDEEGLHANIPHFSSWLFKMNFKIEFVKTTMVTSEKFALPGKVFNVPIGFKTNTKNAFVNTFLKQWIGADTIAYYTNDVTVYYEQPIYTLKLTSGTKEFYFDIYGTPVAKNPVNTTANLIKNPTFSLVEPYAYGPLYGWTIYDTSVKNPLTGGLGASSATAESTWKRFDNAGEGKKYSTAATFVFPEKANYFCSSKSEYVYGDSEGYELLLEPNSGYVFNAQVGYLSEGKEGSVEFSVVNKATDRVVMSSVFSPSVCVSDTTKIPESFAMIFKTDEALDAENYKIVLKNANPNNYWTMVMSNLYLVKLQLENDDEPTIPTNESADTVKVDIATPNTASSENTTTPVVTENKDGEKCYVYNPEDETKNQTVSFTVPVETVAAGNKYYVVIDLVPTDEARIRATYYSFGLKGMPHKTYTRPSTPANEETNVLGSYLYTGDKEERLVFEFTLPEDMDAVEILISTHNPAESASDCTSAIGLKQVSLTTGKETKAGNNATTAIEIANNQKQVVPTEIYTMSGVKVSSLQKGINIIRFSDGTIKKVMY